MSGMRSVSKYSIRLKQREATWNWRSCHCTNIAEYSPGFPSCFVNQVKDLEVPGVHLVHERFMLLQHGVEPELLFNLKTRWQDVWACHLVSTGLMTQRVMMTEDQANLCFLSLLLSAWTLLLLFLLCLDQVSCRILPPVCRPCFQLHALLLDQRLPLKVQSFTSFMHRANTALWNAPNSISIHSISVHHVATCL